MQNPVDINNPVRYTIRVPIGEEFYSDDWLHNYDGYGWNIDNVLSDPFRLILSRRVDACGKTDYLQGREYRLVFVELVA